MSSAFAVVRSDVNAVVCRDVHADAANVRAAQEEDKTFEVHC